MLQLNKASPEEQEYGMDDRNSSGYWAGACLESMRHWRVLFAFIFSFRSLVVLRLVDLSVIV